MFACLIAGLALHAQASVTLVYRPPLKKLYRTRMVTETTQSAMMGGGTMRTQMDTETRAIARNGDVTTVERKITAAKVTAPPGPMAGMVKNMEKSLLGKVTTVQ